METFTYIYMAYDIEFKYGNIYIFGIVFSLYSVSEKIIGVSKMRNMFWFIIKMLIFPILLFLLLSRHGKQYRTKLKINAKIEERG